MASFPPTGSGALFRLWSLGSSIAMVRRDLRALMRVRGGRGWVSALLGRFRQGDRLGLGGRLSLIRLLLWRCQM